MALKAFIALFKSDRFTSFAVRVAFQGERGAYSEEAIELYFGKEGVEPIPCVTIADAFKEVEEGRAEYAVVPIENSIEGSVNETYDMLLETRLRVMGEVKLRIRHCLIGHPDARLEGLKVVYSHPQALAQCRESLRRLGLDTIAYYDTAGSVKMLKEKGIRDAAGIASRRAAEIYGMKILIEGLEDSPTNYTRFLILHERDSPRSGRDKTSIIFTVRHMPGALYKALEVFAKRGINLTMIASRPIKTRPWEYNFYLDFEGHRDDEVVNGALRELRSRATFIKILGSYRSGE